MTDKELLRKLVWELMRMVVTAQKDAAYALALAKLAAHSVPAEIREETRHAVDQAFEPLLRRLDQSPVEDVLQFLRDFHGPIQ